MNALYPLKFKPIFKDKIWGGQKIRTDLGMDFGNLPNCGEVWVISGYNNNVSVVENGYLAGNELNELVEVYMGDLVGDKIFDRFGEEFPLLIKFLNADDWLSIQVHPDDKLAGIRKIGYGKTEMWYVLGADANAQLISGFNQEIDKESYLDHLNSKSLKEILNFEKVEKGDAFFLPAGRVHALGPGSLIAEIQQTSDNTFRIYDWDRIDEEGMERELHIDAAMEAIDFKKYQEYKTRYRHTKNQTNNIIDCPQFTTNIIEFDHSVKKDYTILDSFVIYMGIEGKSTMKWDGGELAIKPGDAVVKPAMVHSLELIPQADSKLLEVYIK